MYSVSAPSDSAHTHPVHDPGIVPGIQQDLAIAMAVIRAMAAYAADATAAQEYLS